MENSKNKKQPLKTWQKVLRGIMVLFTLMVLGFCAYLTFIASQLFAPEISTGVEARTQLLGSMGINLPEEASEISLRREGFVGIDAEAHFSLPANTELLNAWFESESFGCIADPLRPLTEDDLRLDLYRWWNERGATSVIGAACGQTNSFFTAIVVDQSDADSWTIYIKYFID